MAAENSGVLPVLSSDEDYDWAVRYDLAYGEHVPAHLREFIGEITSANNREHAERLVNFYRGGRYYYTNVELLRKPKVTDWEVVPSEHLTPTTDGERMNP